MNIQLIEGTFSAQEALEIITQMIHVKIKFNEEKISQAVHVEDIKAREAKIKRLQKDLFEIRQQVGSDSNKINLNAHLEIM